MTKDDETMNVRTLRTGDLVRLCLRRRSARQAMTSSRATHRSAPSTPPARPTARPSEHRTCAHAEQPTTGATDDPPPPSPLARAVRWALVLAGATAALLALTMSPADAQDGGGGDSGGSMGSGDSGGMGSSTGVGSGLSSGMGSMGGDTGGMGGIGGDTGGMGAIGSDSGSSLSGGMGGIGSDTGIGASIAGDTSLGGIGSDTGLTGFEGSPEVGPDHAAAVNNATAPGDSSIGGATRGIGGDIGADPTGAIGSETSTGGAYAGSETGRTGFEGSPEMGPAHAEAVNTSAPSWGPGSPATADQPAAPAIDGTPTAEAAPAIDGTQVAQATPPAPADQPAAPIAAPNPADYPDQASYIAAIKEHNIATGQVPPPGPPSWQEMNPEMGPLLRGDMARAEQAGRMDAEAARQALAAAGLDPSNFNPSQLSNLDPNSAFYAGAYDALRAMGYQMTNPPRGDTRISEPYAARAYEGLNVDGTRAAVGATNQFAFDQAERGVPGVARTDIMGPLAEGFAAATRSPIAPTDVFAGLRDITTRAQQHYAAQLISGGFSYDPATGLSTPVPGNAYDPGELSQFANAIIGYGRTHPNGVMSPDPTTRPMAPFNPQAFDPYTNPAALMYAGTRPWQGDIAMQVPEALAMRALSVNPEAAWNFNRMDPANLETTLRPTVGRGLADVYGALGYTPQENQALRDAMNQYAAGAFRGTFVDTPMAQPDRYADSLDMYADVVRSVGAGFRPDPNSWGITNQLGMVADRLGLTGRPEVPNAIKREAANALGVYVGDIGQSAVRQSETPYTSLYGDRAAAMRAAEDFNRPDVVDFAQALGMDAEAAGQLGLTIGAWAQHQALPHVGLGVDGRPPVGDLTESMRPVGLITGAIEDGFDAIATDAQKAYQAYAQGVGTVTSVIAAGAGIAAFAAAPSIAPYISAGGATQWGAGTVFGLATTPRSADQPMTGATLENVTVGHLRQDLANAIALQHPDRFDPSTPLTPGMQSRVLGEYAPAVRDALDRLDLTASDEARDYGEFDHWSPR